ncbi:50S ribosomal protein L9 [Anaerolineales bacterium HSG25]|nr:50S ribosomal protein L9 [Anaerolineales bacterium HSG25]
MEVLLIKDVDNLGYAGAVKKVKNGFGRNYLLPQKLAILASPGALKQAETIRRAAEKQRAIELEDAKAIANQITDVMLSFERRAGETGKLYGSVTSSDIARELEKKTSIAIDKRKISLPEPIRQLGELEVTIKIVMDLSTTIKVEVLNEGGLAERARAAAKKAAAEAKAAAAAEAKAKVKAEAAAAAEAKAKIEAEAEAEAKAKAEAAAQVLSDVEAVEPIQTEEIDILEQLAETVFEETPAE